MDITALAVDLRDEHAALDRIVARLDPAGWATPTPAEGWDVGDTIGHVCYFDEAALLALTDPARFAAAPPMPDAMGAELSRSTEPAELLARWRETRAGLLAGIEAATPGERVPWYGPAMSLASFVTARIMETWAHGQDVVDAVGVPPVVTDRLRHVCHIGVQARPYAYAVHEMTDPGDPVRVEATAPSGETWTWGPDAVADRIAGEALDLALVFTQRRHRDDTAVVVEGPVAEQWISIAQAFAGGAGIGRKPGMGRVKGVL